MLSWFRRSPRATPPTPADRSLSEAEAAAVASLVDRFSEDSPTGAFEVTPTGHVMLETSKGGWITPGTTLAAEAAGTVRGKHFTDWVETYKQLKRDGRTDEALELILECRDAAERAAEVEGLEPAPAYTLAAAVIYAQRKDYASEVAVLERHLAACPPSRKSRSVVERLPKAQARLSKASP